MSAEKRLFDAYDEWRRLAKAEGQAIRKRDWNFLLECQDALKKFQPLIKKLTREARDEWKQWDLNFAAKEKNLREVVLELIELGRRNQALLKIARQAAQLRREQLELARWNLKRLQLSYVFARPPAWTSFS
jgi:hypothetical protein